MNHYLKYVIVENPSQKPILSEKDLSFWGITFDFWYSVLFITTIVTLFSFRGQVKRNQELGIILCAIKEKWGPQTKLLLSIRYLGVGNLKREEKTAHE